MRRSGKPALPIYGGERHFFYAEYMEPGVCAEMIHVQTTDVGNSALALRVLTPHNESV